MANDTSSDSVVSNPPSSQSGTAVASSTPAPPSAPPSTSTPPPAPPPAPSTTYSLPSAVSSPTSTAPITTATPAPPTSIAQTQPTAPANSDPPSQSSGDGDQPNPPSYENSAENQVPPAPNTDSQGRSTGRNSLNDYGTPKVTPSTWITVVDATPTVMTFSGITSVSGSNFQTAFAVTTSFGGHSTTITSLVPDSTAGSDGSTQTTTGTTNHLGVIIGSTVGAVVFILFTLLMCRVCHRRRSIMTQERQMMESWLSRPFSRARRSRFRDMDLNIEVHTTTEFVQDPLPLHHQHKSPFKPLSPLMPLSPITLSAFKSPFSSIRRKRSHRLADLGSISAPVGPVTVQGDSTAIQSALQPLHAKDPFLDPDDEKIHGDYCAQPNLSRLTKVMEERDHRQTTTDGDYYRIASSIDTHSSLSHYSDGPFSDFNIIIDPLPDDSPSNHNRESMQSDIRSFPTTRYRDSIPPDSLLLSGGPTAEPTSFTAFINETRED